MFDSFAIASDQTYFGHEFGDEEDWIFVKQFPGGTNVYMD